MTTPPELARCNDHGLVLLEGDRGHHTHCIACEFDVEVRLDDTPTSDTPPLTNEFTNRLEWETVQSLIPLMREYVADEWGTDLFVTHVAWEGELPAGYTEQERFFAVIGYEKTVTVGYVMTDPAGKATVETLRDEGYGEGE